MDLTFPTLPPRYARHPPLHREGRGKSICWPPCTGEANIAGLPKKICFCKDFLGKGDAGVKSAAVAVRQSLTYAPCGDAATPSVCFADTSLLYRVPAQMRSRCVGRGDASRAGKPRGTQRRTCGLCGDEATRRQGNRIYSLSHDTEGNFGCRDSSLKKAPKIRGLPQSRCARHPLARRKISLHFFGKRV